MTDKKATQNATVAHILMGHDEEFQARMKDLESRARERHCSEADITFANAVLRETQNRGQKDQCKALYWRGMLSYLRGEYQAAMMYDQAAIDLAEGCDVEAPFLLRLKRSRIGTLLQLGRYEELQTLATQLIEQVDDDDVRAHVLYPLGVSYYNLGQYDAAIAHIKRAIEMTPESIEQGVFLSRCYAVLGTTYHRSGKLCEAIETSVLSLQIARRSGDELCEVYALLILGEVELDLKNIAKAYLHFSHGLEISERNPDRKLEHILMRFALARCEESPFRKYEAMDQVLTMAEEVELSPRDLADMHEHAATEAFTIGRYASGKRHHETALRTLREVTGKGNMVR